MILGLIVEVLFTSGDQTCVKHNLRLEICLDECTFILGLGQLARGQFALSFLELFFEAFLFLFLLFVLFCEP